MKMPEVSVIVPVYNVEKYLPRCIDSILAQTFTDFELILVDDGSPDNCGAICDEYAARDKRVMVIHQENAKASAARNAGIGVAKSEWLAFIDPDDWIHKDYLSILYSGIIEGTDVVICECKITNCFSEVDVDYSGVGFIDLSLKDVYANHVVRTRVWGRLYRKKTLGDLRFISGTEPAEDSCFNELLFRGDMTFRITNAKLYYYYMRPDSAIHTHFGRGTFNSIGPLLERLEKIQDPEKRRRIISRCYKYVLSARYGEMYTNDYADVLKKCRELFSQLKKYLPELNVKDRMVMRAFSAFPSLYRAWRIHDDPTLLQFEKNKKRGSR